jgi:D-glycero-alpha-D-manno-heptose 1-phosphate guanylyltransferase
MTAPITEAVILAGGLGTRLQTAVPNLPKCLAPVAGKPFLHHVIAYLQQQGIVRFVFSLGHLSDMVAAYVRNNHPRLDAVFVAEPQPLGTGGALQLACGQVLAKNVLAVNGDTLFKINLTGLAALHHAQGATCTLALKQVEKAERYGTVQVAADGRITGFAEKGHTGSGCINGGAYLLNVAQFLAEAPDAPFSFEKDYLQSHYAQRKYFGQVQNGYFIDIGVPTDYERADRELGDE